MPKFSVALIAKNEVRTLPRLAESLKDFFQRGGEAVIVDTGSTDGTPELARSLGFKVIEVGDKFTHTVTASQAKEINGLSVLEGEQEVVKEGQRVFDFAEAMNFAASQTENDWIVMPDADIAVEMDIDRLEAEMTEGRSHLRHILKMGNLEYWHNRVFNRAMGKWEGMSHEGFYGNGSSFDLPKDVLTMDHEQYLDVDRASRIGSLALDWFLHQDSYRKTYYYGRDLYWRNRPKSAIAMLKKALAFNYGWKPEAAQALCFIGDAYLALKDEDNAVKSYKEAFDACPQRRIAFLKLAQYYTGKDWHKTAAYALSSLEIPYAASYIEDMNDYGYLPHYYAYPALYQIGDKKGSKEHFLKARELAPNNPKIKVDEKWYLDPKVSVVIPHLPLPEREVKLRKLLSSLEKTTYPNYEVIVENDSWEDRQGVPLTLKKGVERSTGELVMYLGNDCEVTPSTITEAVEALRQFPDLVGLVSLNDGQTQGRKAEHWIAPKKLLPFIGGEFFSTAYEHNFCDLELLERSKLFGRYAYADKASIYHDHPMWRGTPSDRCYDVAYDKERWARDEATYNLRKTRWTKHRIHDCQGYEKMPKTELCLLAEKYKSDKCPSIFHAYTPKYSEMLADIRDTAEKVLEIGIGTPQNMSHVAGYAYGASLFMWRDWFAKAHIYAIDNAPESMVNISRITSMVCDQSSAEQLEDMATKFVSNFDLIVDDGSHNHEHQITSAKALVPHLSTDGYYIIEDIWEPSVLLAAFSDMEWEIDLYNLNLAFSKWDRLMVIRKPNPDRKERVELPYTGERVVPDKMFVEPQTLAEHLARYEMSLKYIHGDVLDAPCGTGYGTKILGRGADDFKTFGCDISEEALKYARNEYSQGGFFMADLDNPNDYLDGKYETVVSFEGLEHLFNPRPFIEWVRTTAETFIFSIPVNNISKWHKHAYSVEQIKGLFKDYASVEWFEQTGTVIKPLVEGSVPVFLIGVAKTR